MAANALLAMDRVGGLGELAEPKGMHLTAGIRVKDGEPWAEECLRSLGGFVDDIVILDDGSTDRTVEVCRSFDKVRHLLRWPKSFSREALARDVVLAMGENAAGTLRPTPKPVLGKRVSQRTPEGYTEFIYQGPDMLKLQMERDEDGETRVQYTMGAGLESMRRDAGGGMASGDSSFFHYNHLGTTIALTNPAESVSDTYRHDAWGVLLAQTHTGQQPTPNPHTYVGRERYYRMPEPDLYHLGFRDYDQHRGSFLSPDPVQLVGRRLGYAENQVTVMIDPDGRIQLICCGPVQETRDEVGREFSHWSAAGPCTVTKWAGDVFKGKLYIWTDRVEFLVSRDKRCWFCCSDFVSWSVHVGQKYEYEYQSDKTKSRCLAEACINAVELFKAGNTQDIRYEVECQRCCDFRYPPVPDKAQKPPGGGIVDMRRRECYQNCGRFGLPEA